MATACGVVRPHGGGTASRSKGPDDAVGWAVVGLGKYATGQILPSFAACKKSRLSALVTGDRGKGESLASAYGLGPDRVFGYDDLERLRDDHDVRVVYVVTPPGLHAEHAVRAARAGKHVLTEKPMARTPGECEEMIRACRDAGVKLMVAYRARYEPYNEKVIEMARGGRFGTIKSVTSEHGRAIDTSEPADAWRVKKALAGGGSLYDIGIYSLQAARYLVGEEPTEVSAMIHSPPGDKDFAEVEETIHFMLRFPGGALANCTSSFGYEGLKRFTVVGAEAVAELDPATDYYEHRLRVTTKEGTTEPKVKSENQFARQMDHFSECVKTGASPRTPGEEGLRDVVLMQEIYEAAASGRTRSV